MTFDPPPVPPGLHTPGVQTALLQIAPAFTGIITGIAFGCVAVASICNKIISSTIITVRNRSGNIVSAIDQIILRNISGPIHRKLDRCLLDLRLHRPSSSLFLHYLGVCRPTALGQHAEAAANFKAANRGPEEEEKYARSSDEHKRKDRQRGRGSKRYLYGW